MPPVNLQEKDVNKSEEQEHLDKLKYLRLKKVKGSDAISLRELITLPVNDRPFQQQFFLRMHLKCEVPFFFDFDRHTIENLTKVMTREVF